MVQHVRGAFRATLRSTNLFELTNAPVKLGAGVRFVNAGGLASARPAELVAVRHAPPEIANLNAPFSVYTDRVPYPPKPPAHVRPTVILPDTSPLVHLAAAGALHILTGLGRVVIVDVVALEATSDASKPYATEIAAWIADGAEPGSNRPVEIAATELGPLYKLALDQNIKPPRNAGEIGIADWLASELPRLGGPALVVYENGRIPNMLAREGIAETIAVATTRNLLELAQREGLIPDAEALWTRIVRAAPTANPASVLTVINPAKP
jgi:hypothetical protein